MGDDDFDEDDFDDDFDEISDGSELIDDERLLDLDDPELVGQFAMAVGSDPEGIWESLGNVLDIHSDIANAAVGWLDGLGSPPRGR